MRRRSRVEDRLVAFDGHGIRLEAVPAGFKERAAGFERELPPVPGTTDHTVVHAVNELVRCRTHEGAAQRPGAHRSAHVRAAVVDGVELSPDADHPDRVAVDLDDPAALTAQVLGLADPVLHPALLPPTLKS